MDRNPVAENLIATLWEQAKLRAELPASDSEFLSKRGPTRGRYESRRTYHRFYLRTKAILEADGSLLGIYTKDVSRRGIGFVSPIHLDLGSNFRLRLPSGANYMIEVDRCSAVGDRSFDCGARFVRGNRSTSGEP